MQIITSIQNRIYELRSERVMLDKDLAFLYEIETKVFNQAVKRNINRFPADYVPAYRSGMEHFKVTNCDLKHNNKTWPAH